jgi:nucleoside-diphosphate-sugar epimerase
LKANVGEVGFILQALEKEMATTEQLPDSVMIFGCGYVGRALAEYLLGAGVRVGALTRNETKAESLESLGVDEVIVAELDDTAWHAQVKKSYQAVVNCVSSAGGGIDGYRKSYVQGQAAILDWARSRNLRCYIYTSSTSVYPQDGGVTVHESTDSTEAPATGQVLLEAEAMLSGAEGVCQSWYVLRLAGIYGPGRHFLLNQLREGGGEIPGRGDYAMNMIHLDDVVSAIAAALYGAAPSGIYNITDDAPASKARVLSYLAAQLNMSEPVFNPDKISERLKRRGGRMPHRFVSNAKARNVLDWTPKYPSYREGYGSLLVD